MYSIIGKKNQKLSNDYFMKVKLYSLFSSKGYPYDNVVAESFFKLLKLEKINRRVYYTKK